MSMENAPKFEGNKDVIKTIEEEAVQEKDIVAKDHIGETGGIADQEVVDRNIAAKKAEAEASYNAKPTNEAKGAPRPTLSEVLPILTNRLNELKSEKVGFFKRIVGGNSDAIELINKAIYKINKDKGFEKDFIDAYVQGKEKLALEYAESIGAGNLVRPVEGTLMVTGGTNSESYMPK